MIIGQRCKMSICRINIHNEQIYLLVDSHADGTLGDVEHNTGAAVVVLERHTLVDGGVDLDINIVSSLQITKK